MKIINKLDITTWLHKEKCYRCKTEMEIDLKDLKYKTDLRYGGEYHTGSLSDVFYISCPVCNHDITIHDNDFGDLTFLIQQHVKEKFSTQTKSKKK